MKVRELIEILQRMPQEVEVYIHDADESRLLTIEAHDVWHSEPDRPLGYPRYDFERVEIGGDYDERRVKRK